MDTYLWRYTHPRDGHVITKDHFTEAEATRIFPEPERVEGSLVLAEDGGRVEWHLACAGATWWHARCAYTSAHTCAVK